MDKWMKEYIHTHKNKWINDTHILKSHAIDHFDITICWHFLPNACRRHLWTSAHHLHTRPAFIISQRHLLSMTANTNYIHDFPTPVVNTNITASRRLALLSVKFSFRHHLPTQLGITYRQCHIHSKLANVVCQLYHTICQQWFIISILLRYTLGTISHHLPPLTTI